MPKQGHHYQILSALLLLAAGWVAVAGAGSRSSESDLAAPGAPLYENAVTESVNSLMSKEEQAEHRPPSPGPDYFWCENCKTYHKRQAPASGPQPAAAQRPGAAPASLHQPAAATVARPPSPGPDYFWCENCKTYHKRQTPAAAGQPAVARTPGAAQTLPRQPGAATAARPPSPGTGYYWCEQCKSYHQRQAVLNQPGAAAQASPGKLAPRVAPAAGPGVSRRPPSPGEGYYWCEQCKTYHRRQPTARQPAVDVSRIVGGVSNSPNRSPLIGPAGAER